MRRLWVFVILAGCGGRDSSTVADAQPKDAAQGDAVVVDASQADARPMTAPDAANEGPKANVTAVEARGEARNFTFSVTIESPDTGCEQYADWWEVLDFDGELLYRRILAHSHVDEQPFTRSGGPVVIGPDTQVWIRAHMNTGGYGLGMKGSPAVGFEQTTTPRFRTAEQAPPQPDGCAF